MDQGPLVAEQIESGARFLSELTKYIPVQVAFWLKDSEEGGWQLYVASDQITDDNFDVAYGEVARITEVLQDPWFDPFQVKLIGKDDALAKDVADLQRRYSSQAPLHFHGKTLGGFTVDEVYLYPSPTPAPVQP